MPAPDRSEPGDRDHQLGVQERRWVATRVADAEQTPRQDCHTGSDKRSDDNRRRDQGGGEIDGRALLLSVGVRLKRKAASS